MTERTSSTAGGGSSGDPGLPGSPDAGRRAPPDAGLPSQGATRQGLSRGAKIGALASLVAAGVILLVTMPAAQAPQPPAQTVTQAPVAAPPGQLAPPPDSAPRALPFAVGGAPAALAQTETSEPDDDEAEEASPAEAYVYEPAESPALREAPQEVKLAPRAPVTAEPLVPPPALVIDAELAPRVPVTSEPLVPRLLEIQAEPAASRR